MTNHHTLSVLDWHEDGTGTWSRWVISTDEKYMVQVLLGRAADREGVVTLEQANEARAATQQWVSAASMDSPASPGAS
ncbi:hypothetical protein ACIF8W_28240 [Streptomyces sp. NPDC085639]|uniref:hypothetical protein n=1 Tax=Streptomyces sp. NPDC085639 TaxID=3365734 RepID=UPI0037CD1D72